MLKWFTPQCPIELKKKVWIEKRMRWLADTLGRKRMLDAVLVTPTTEFFPDVYEPTLECIGRLMDRIKIFMGVSTLIDLEIAPEDAMETALGLYHQGSPSKIQVNEKIIDDPFAVAATLSHELAHEILLGGALIDSREPDHEPVTDLLMIFLGVGIIATNETVKARAWHEGNMEYFSISKSGYLSAREFGYALALFAFHRGEEAFDWARYLRPDAADVLKKGLRFLKKTGDTIYRPERPDDSFKLPSSAVAIEWLRDGSPSRQLIALWDLTERPKTDGELLPILRAMLRNREQAIGEAAADALAAMREDAAPALPDLIAALHSQPSAVRAACARALPQLQRDPADTLPDLELALRDVELSVAAAAAESLGMLVPYAEKCITPLLRAIDAALFRDERECGDAADRMIFALSRIAGDAPARVKAFYEEGNDEHRMHILGQLRLLREASKRSSQPKTARSSARSI
jgi:HEAT repeat protein